MPKRTTDFREGFLADLADPQEAANYLNAALEDSEQMALVALRGVAEARQMARVQLSERFGAQCVVAGIDSQTTAEGYRVYQFTGDPARARDTRRDTLAWVREVQQRGAGEIVLNCMASDGTRHGYDIEQLRRVRALCSVPLVASGGAGAPEHFATAFRDGQVDATLAASVFHSGAILIPQLKRQLHAQGIEVRL